MASSLVDNLDSVVGSGNPVVSVAPVELSAPGRPVPLEVRVSVPVDGTNLPVVLFSHGNGWNLDGYAPLTAYWASRGFVVVQPTHLDSRRYGFGFDHPVFPSIWTERIADLTRVLDKLDALEAAVPGLAGRVDRSRVAATGHSWGGQTAQSLLGARILDEAGRVGVDMSDSRVTAGDHDQSRMSSRGPDWFTDAYTFSPGATDLLTLHGAEHALGGVVGYDVAETTDEDPERVAVIQRMSTAYLRTALRVEDASWPAARAAFSSTTDPIGHLNSR